MSNYQELETFKIIDFGNKNNPKYSGLQSKNIINFVFFKQDIMTLDSIININFIQNS